jgi:hypothetical protein
MINRGPSFLAVVWFAPSPPLSSANCISFTVSLCVAGPAYWRESEEGGGGRGTESYDRKKAWAWQGLCTSFNPFWYKTWTWTFSTAYLIQLFTKSNFLEFPVYWINPELKKILDCSKNYFKLLFLSALCTAQLQDLQAMESSPFTQTL